MSLKLVPFESFGMLSYSHLIHSNYGSILYRFRDKARYWTKIAIFFIFFAFDAPLGDGTSQNITMPFGLEKL